MISEETEKFLKEVDLEVLGQAMCEVFYTLDNCHNGSPEVREFDSCGFTVAFVTRDRWGDSDTETLHFRWDELADLNNYVELLKQKRIEEKEKLRLLDEQNKIKSAREQQDRELKELERLQKKYSDNKNYVCAK